MSGTVAVAAPRSGTRRGGTSPNWVLPGASLDLAFADGRGYAGGGLLSAGDLLTTTRASDAYADNSTGVWSLFGSGVPRITDKGLLVEESRTNSIRNNSMQGAVAGSPGTLPTNWTYNGAAEISTEVVASGSENGVDYVDVRFYGTTTTSRSPLIYMEATAVVAATPGQVWANSAFASVVGGSTENISAFYTGVFQVTAGSLQLTAFTPTANLTRYGAAYTVAASTTSLRPVILFITGIGVVDITLRIGWPQLELGAFATSPIRTTSAAATRAADLITVNDFSSWFNAAEGTLFAELDGPLAATASTARIFGLTNDASNLLQLWHWSGSPGLARFRGLSSGATQFDFASTGALTAGPHKIAGAYKLNDSNFAEDGTVKTSDTSCTVPTLTGAAIDGINTYIRRLAYFPTRLSNAQLQALTS